MAFLLRANRICNNYNYIKNSLFKSISCTSIKYDSASTSLQKADTRPKTDQITAAIKSYLKKFQQYENMMDSERKEFELGKRHLAHMMDEDPENFSQDQIDCAISYLFPSALNSLNSRPKLKPPEYIFPKEKSLQCDMTGRPYDALYYTGKPNYYRIMLDAALKLEELKLEEDSKKSTLKPVYLLSTKWMSQKELQSLVIEKVDEPMYNKWVLLMTRLSEHPFSDLAKDFIMKFRISIQGEVETAALPEPMVDEVSGRRYAEAYGQRKWAVSDVRLFLSGSGKITINGKRLLDYFPDIGDRKQVLFPLIFTEQIGLVDFDANVSGGGISSQSGALRLSISRALACLLEKEELRRMRLAGLLTQDMRFKERKKPGRVKARKLYTWKAR